MLIKIKKFLNFLFYVIKTDLNVFFIFYKRYIMFYKLYVLGIVF